MDFSGATTWIVIPTQIFFLDLLLCADNAVVIALACRSLHPDDTRKAVLLGTGGAVVFRLVMTIAASFLLTAPYLKLASALILIVIAINVIGQETQEDLDPFAEATSSSLATRGSLWSAALSIVLIDAAMSLDNIVALAAIARGNAWLLAAGVLFSIPVLAFGGLILAKLLQDYPVLVAAGCGLLGWVAGDMAISDPAIADWANAQAPALVLISPLLGGAFVLAEARFMTKDIKKYAKANVARAPGFVQDARRLFPSQQQVSLANRLPKIAWKVAKPNLKIRAAPRDLGSPPARQARSAWLARKGNARENRIVLTGLILWAATAAGMIGYVLHLDSLLAR